MRSKNFLTFFPKYEDFHFWKDPGQIPFRFIGLGYNSKILTRDYGDYPVSKKYMNVEILKTKLIFNKDFGIISYFIKHSKSIDVLNIFHLHSFESLFAAFIYKLLNPKGFVYLKMDNCHLIGIYPWEKIFDKNVVPVSFLSIPRENCKWKIKKFLIKNFFIKKIDLFSVEDEVSKKYFEDKYTIFKDKIIVAYNGHATDLLNNDIKIKSFDEKENLIITVGRLGTFQKNTLNLLKGFALTATKHNWNLELAGSIDPKFIAVKDEFIKQWPELCKRIKFLGNLEKPKLYDLYNRAKIFLLPSNFEGFAIVYSEAMFFGNAIITSYSTSLRNKIKTVNIGLLVNPQDPEDIGKAILKLIYDEKKLKKYCSNARKFAEDELNWNNIVRKVDYEIKNRINDN